jgi:protein phosphatase
MSLPLYVHGRTDVGRQRTGNEDSFRVVREADGSFLLIVCDGMGGHEGGEVASEVAATRIVESARAHLLAGPAAPALFTALTEANQAVIEAARASGGAGMGTTAVVVWVASGRCHVGWVGDSRFYMLRDGQIVDQSIDHTRVAALVAQGILSREGAKRHADAHILTQALGGEGFEGTFKPEVWNESLELRAGDVVLLCSDGMYDLIADEEIGPLIAGLDHAAAVDRLVEEANRRGGHDNITVIALVAGAPVIPQLPAPVLREAPRAARAVPTVASPAPTSPPPEPITQPSELPARGEGLFKSVPLWVAIACALGGIALGIAACALLGRGFR